MYRRRFSIWLKGFLRRGTLPAVPLTILLAGLVGLLGGYGSLGFTWLINSVEAASVDRVLVGMEANRLWLVMLCASPAIGLLVVAWLTRRLVGLLLRSDVMRRYRIEMLRRR